MGVKWTDFESSLISWRIAKDGYGEKKLPNDGLMTVASIISIRNVDDLEVYALSSRVMAGKLYSQESFPQDPAYSFEIIVGGDRHWIMRDYSDSSNDSEGSNTVFEEIELVERETYGTIVAPEEVARKAEGLGRLNGKVEYDFHGQEVSIRFPVRHISRILDTGEFQVETGPLLVPLSLQPLAWTKGFFFANSFHRGEFLLWESVSGPGESRSYNRSFTPNLKFELIERLDR